MGNKRVCALFLMLAIIFAGSLAAAEAPLADAVEKQNRAGIEKLLAEKVDIDQQQVDGMTALHWAVYHDDLETARLLVTTGANVKAANRYGVTPLPLACANGNTELVEVLLASGADPNTTLRGGETALMTAARTGKPGPVKALLARGANVDATERKGQSALVWAAAEGHAEVVNTLLGAGADFRTPLASGFTPLLFAVREGHAEVVQILLAAGADVKETIQPKRKSEGGRAANAGAGPLTLAVENGHFELAVALLRAGADPNDQRSGFAPLHTMSWVRKPNRGEGEDGDPPPRGSGTMTSLQFVRELVAYGADVNLRLKRGQSGRGMLTRTGATPFLLASFTADAALMRLLVELGADPLVPNADGCTPLMAAVGVGTRFPGEEAGTEPEVLEALALLLELGADVNTVDKNGETPMHGAAYKSLSLVVQVLADKGAQIDIWNQKNKYGWTPLLIAEGHRVGNFKPNFETIAALHRVMLAAGVTPPPPTPREVRKGYE
jgi:ankyrin repeat protein